MLIFIKNITVSTKDIDARNHVNNVRYVQWVQDIAEDNWIKNTTTTLRETYYWVMLSHHIQYKAEAVLGDKLQLKTFVTKAEGFRSTRIVEIYNQNTNKLLSLSETIWCLMSHKTNKPTRISQEIIDLFQ
ncbi:acyl-CoA thioesterase [Psychroserpens ponticola]|uniref:Thioesterase family protein n=1 Tax=Psychroserpens ponticola TaxID=2932268 RepID=A0ABY7RU68_9FLAO|nr:thioesterase family protein [Psychroserpens ponticola]WCO00469.1 thioesterase family protein [Psychroserpens ponticola]